MLTQSSVAVLMAGKGETLEAIERVCDKRSLRGEKPENVINYLNGLADRWKLSPNILEGIYELKSYWIARQA